MVSGHFLKLYRWLGFGMTASPDVEPKSLFSRFKKLSIPIRRVIAFAAGGLLCVLIFLAFAQIATYFLARSYVEEVEQVFDLNHHAANAVVWATFAVATLLVGSAISFSRRKRLISFAGIIVLLIAHSALLAYGTMHENFRRADGSAIKCYVVTRDALELRDHPGIDPVTGRDCRPVTAEIAERVEAYKNGRRPTRIASREPTFFDPRTGQPIVWYSIGKNEEIELFDLMGFQPDTGQELIPVTKEIVARWKDQSARRLPRKVDDPKRYGPFDPITGKARLWYRAGDDGAYEFYDAAGYHPQTGDPLKLVTRDVMTAWELAQKNQKRWYLITRDADHPVHYCQAGGLDQATGRMCREITTQVLERLREYEKGKRPQRIAAATPAFFEPRSGEPIAWYSKDKAGKIELFDLMGYHPATGDELLPVTKEIAAEWNDQQRQKPPRAPNQVQLGPNVLLFDPMTGAPRLWFSRTGEADYQFFDGPGFNPRSGEPLKSFTKAEATAYFDQIRNKERKLKEEQDRLDKERKTRAENEQKQREADEQRRRDEERKREEQQRILTEAARDCDNLAANPNDPRRVGAGVEYAALKGQADAAVKACASAAQQNPTEPRFRYQLARALQLTDRLWAFGLLQDLVKQGYPAAFDNLGWMYFMDKHSPEQAVALFRRGVQAGDPDAMLSLAEMIERQHTVAMNPSENKLALYQRAAQLGSQAAATAYNTELNREQQEADQRRIQLQQQQMMMQIIGGVLQRR